MASSGNFETKFSKGYYIGVDWKQTEQNTTNNTSKVTATVYIRSIGSGYTINSSQQKTIKVVIDGTTYSGTNTVGLNSGAKKNLLTASKVVSHNSDGSKSCAISCSAAININFSSGHQGTVSSSGTADLNKNNLNTAPYFDSGAYVTIRENNSNGRVISASASGTENANKYPENVASLYVSWPAVRDKETTSGVTYVLMCQANESSWWEQWRGSGTSYTHDIGVGNQNQSIDYYVYAIDNGGLRSENIDALQVQKNKFTAATLSASGNIVHSTGNQTITISRSGASNTYTGSGAAINYNLSAKINSTNITVYNSSASGDLTIVPGTQTVSNPHIRLGDIRNAVRDSSYNGTLTLTLTSSNNWGSSGTSSKDISVDLRTNPVAGANGVSIDSSSYYAVPNGSATVNSIVPARKKIKLVWSAASDPNGTPITYRVEQQIGTGSWTTLTSSTSNAYYEFNTNVSGKPTYKWRVYAKNSYGREILLSGTPSAILYNYSAPSISIKSTVRTSNSFTINFSTAISTELAGNSIKSITLNYGGKDTSISTTATSAKLTGLSENSTGVFKLTIVDIHGATFGVAGGVADGSIPQFYPVLSIRKNGVGVNTIPNGTYDFEVKGKANINGTFTVNGNPIQMDTSNLVKKSDLATKQNVYGKIPQIGTDGVMEVGKYIDFHDGDNGQDYSARITCNGTGLSINGALATGGNLTVGGTIIPQSYIQLPNSGGSWINGATNGNIRGTKQSTGSYHPIISQTTSSNHKISLGGLGDNFGFYLYDANRTENGFDKEFTFNLANKNLYTTCRTIHNEWIYCEGNYGLYFPTHNGGWYMSDSTWVRSYADKNIYTGGTIKAGNAMETRYINSIGGNLDINSRGNTLFINVNADSGANLNINRQWSGSQGTEVSIYNNKGKGWGYLGNTSNTFYRVYGVGGSVSARESKYEILKADTETQYDNVKALNIYNYRSISDERDEEGNVVKEYKREDLFLGCMVDELPLETVFYDTEDGDGKIVNMYSYTSMILGALKETIKKVESLERELEELKNGNTN